MLMKLWFVLFLLVAACGRAVPDNARIVIAGDSIMAWNRSQGGAVAQQLEPRLGEQVGDVSLAFARVSGGQGPLNIANQLANVRADWIVLNGGANDLGRACGCSGCLPALRRLVSEDGTRGDIPELVTQLRSRGAKVLWVDYYTAPRFAGTRCDTLYQTFQNRLQRMALADAGVVMLDLDTVFDPDDLRLFDRDRVHPSLAGSRKIAQEIARVIEPRL